MTRRQLYQYVAERGKSPRLLLRHCVAAMRALRGLPAVLPRSARALLDDPDFKSILSTDDGLGLVFQAINAPRLEQAYRLTARHGTKFATSEIPAVSQLFTPPWVVRFLLERSLSRMWEEMHDGRSRLCCRARDIRLIDPACGTMNFGLVAIEVLETMYRQEMDNAGRPRWPSEPSVRAEAEIPAAIIQHNLFGIDIDPLALWLAAESLEMKLRQPIRRDRLQLRCADALFDPSAEDGSFDIVVTNPPYVSARNLPAQTVRRMKRRYPRAWRDTYTCFIERSLELARPGGRAALLSMHSFMFTGAFEPLRRHLFDNTAIEAIAHFGPGLFDVGNPGTLQTVATVLRREHDSARRDDTRIWAARLVEAEDKSTMLGELKASAHAGASSPQPRERFVLSQAELRANPRGAWIYWIRPELRRTFSALPRLAELAPPRQGLATTDNRRFVRYWWEVEPTASDAPCRATPGMWRNYVKAGRFRRWHESPRHRVNWLDDGAQIKQAIVDRYPYLNGQWKWVAKNSSYYGREGVTYSYLTSGNFSARQLPAGAIFDVAGSSLFPEDPLTILAALNSRVAQQLLDAINPTVNHQVGDLAQLPVPRQGTELLRDDVRRAIEIQRQLDRFDETSPEFAAPLPWGKAGDVFAQLHAELRSVEDRIERQVGSLYGLDEPPQQAVLSQPAFDQVELARRWVSWALRRVLSTDHAVRVWPADGGAVSAIQQLLEAEIGLAARQGVESAIGGVARFLAEEFFDWHLRLYERRPIIWLLGTRHTAWLILNDHATVERVERATGWVPKGWGRFVDDGVAVNLAPLALHVPHRGFQKLLAEVDQDLKQGRYDWSQTAAKLSRAWTCGSAPSPARRLRKAAGRPAKACT